ncbi:hypothetical protein EGW08_015416 [Elysia chlorotica]|uniref:G-protein coupled receptors family 1 profile domain-containing protein n=1 Tax=Elysia chlorotica TaxID=188477 RepID=A0A433T5J3_ELYCH|nr:hypothetical protein EGW08_015416 [Elysia chlorotica]
MTASIKETYIWVAWALGFPGNVLCVVTVLSMSVSSPATFLVSALAVSDGLTISIKLLVHQLARMKVFLGTVGCKTMFLPLFLTSVANWILVFICGERYVAVCYPLKKIYIVTKRRCQVSVAVLTLLHFILFGSIFFVMRDSDDSGFMCGTYNEYLSFWMTGWYWINTSISLFIPFLCIVLLTALIVCGLIRSREERRSIFGKTANGSKRLVNDGLSYRSIDGSSNGARCPTQRLLKEAEAVEKSITLMLIVAASIFLVLALPACIYLLTYKQPVPGERRDPLTEARWALLEQIQFIFIDFSHAINFFLYFLSTQRFRRQLFHVIRCKRLPRKDHQSRTLEMTNVTHP